MTTTYQEPPKVTVDNLIGEGDYLTAIGSVTMKDNDGNEVDYSYCDVWRFVTGSLLN